MLFVMTILFWVAVYNEGRPVFWAGLAAIATYYAVKGWWDGDFRSEHIKTPEGREQIADALGHIFGAVLLWGAPVAGIYLARLIFGGHG
jgi:hypothetical protein